MPRGGKRDGAGRPAKLTFFQRLTIGGECETRWRNLLEESIRAQLATLPGSAERKAAHAAAGEVPIEERRGWLSTYEGEDHLDDVQAALHTMNGIRDEDEWPDEPAPRIFSFVPVRPYGKKIGIKDDVAAHFSATWGIRILRGTVTRCWDEFRAFELQTRPG
jgi:hypothetical protein